MKILETPLIKIKYKYNNIENYLYVKLESYNITGSIKDRAIKYMIEDAYSNNLLKEGDKIVEVTSGNTGISLASIAHNYNNSVHIFMPDWVSVERLKLIKMYGARVTLFSKESGGFISARKNAYKYALENNAYYIDQFNNLSNVKAHYDTTAIEILNKVNNISGIVSGIGTGGTLMGIGKRFKEFNKNIKIIALEPEGYALLSNKKTNYSHKIEGIGDDFIPNIVDKNLIDEIVLVNDMDSINMSKKIASNLGIGVGISSGANFIASVLSNDNGDNKIVTVFADDNKKYLSTDLSGNIDNNKGFISNKIELLGYEFV